MRPVIKITMKVIMVIDHELKLDLCRFEMVGRMRVISTSKTRKIIAIMKNRIENGWRDDFMGSNPHSKGEDFSWSSVFLIESIEAREFIRFAINKANMNELMIDNIIYSFMWIF